MVKNAFPPREPCKECGARGPRHKKGCSKFTAAKARKPSEEVSLALFLDRLPNISDENLAEYLKACTTEASERRMRILKEAADRVKMLEAAMPQVKPLAPEVPLLTGATAPVDPEDAEEEQAVEAASRDAAQTAPVAPVTQTGPGPRPFQNNGRRRMCGAHYDGSDVAVPSTMICTQFIQGGADVHDGDHYNHQAKKSWPQRFPPQASPRKFPPRGVPA